MKNNTYIDGGAYGVCATCGFKYRLRQLRRQWDKLIVCNTCYDDYPYSTPKVIRGEDQPLRNANPEPTDVFKDPTALPDTNP